MVPLNETFHSHLATLPSTARERFMRLLPLELHEHVRTTHSCSDVNVVAIHTHLSRLYTTLRGAVPQWLLLSLDRGERTPARMSDATLLLADVTGFTRLTKQLELFGRIGNEFLTEAINHLFTILVSAAHAHQGDIVAFSGDGLLVAFTGRAHAADALYAACDMQESLASFVRHDDHESLREHVQLRIKIGLASGPIVLVDAGSEHRRAALGLGHIFNVVDTLISQAAPGTIRLDPATAIATAHVANFCQQADGSMLLRGVNAVPTSIQATVTVPTSLPLIDLMQGVMALATFIPNDMLDTLVSKPVIAIGDGEQREVVSMFVHLVGLHELTAACGAQRMSVLTACATIAMKSIVDIIEQHGGTLARVDTYANGHKILALFGTPIARGRIAERSVCAALTLREELPSINQCLADHLCREHMTVSSEVPAIDLSLRIGIQSGQVVAGLVGSPQRWEYTVLGDSINIAARLMANAELARHEILVGPDVFLQLSDIVRAESRQLLLKGMEQPIVAWSIHSLEPVRVRQPKPIYPLVGREPELRLLETAIKAFGTGNRTCIIVQGEPGVGKTRLVHELPAMLAPQSMWIETRASGTVATPFGPIRALIAALCQTDSPFDAAQLQAGIHRYCPDKAPMLSPILSTLMGWHQLDASDWGKDPETQRRVSAWAVHELLTNVAAQRPLVWLWEDVHEADEVSLALLKHVLLKDWAAPFLWCITLRPISASSSAAHQFVDSLTRTWGDQVMRLNLTELSADAAGQLLDTFLPGVSQSTRAALFAHANGNPLFLEVLAQQVRNQHLVIPTDEGLRLRADLTLLGVPRTAREVIAAQIDCLPVTVRRVAAAIAAAAEVEFCVPEWLLEQIVNQQGGLETALHILEQALIILRSDADTKPTYTFRHALYQRTVYDRLLDKERRTLHSAIGHMLHIAKSSDKVVPLEVLAFHCYEGQVWELAAMYGLQAGLDALHVYAFRGAWTHLRRTLGLARRLNQPSLEVDAREGLAQLHAHRGRYPTARAHMERIFAQRRQVISGNTNMVALVRQQRLIALIDERSGKYEQAEQACMAGLQALATINDASIEAVRIYIQLAEIYWRLGYSQKGEQACHDGLRLLVDEKQTGREHVELLQRIATIVGQRGQYHQAIEQLQHSLVRARALGDPALIGQILNNLGMYYLLCNQTEAALEVLQESLAIKRQIDDVMGLVRSTENVGIVYQNLGDYDTAARYFLECCANCTRLNLPHSLANATDNLGNIYYLQGRFDEAEATLRRAYLLFETLADLEGMADCCYRLGEVALAQHRPAVAREYGEAALRYAQTSQSDVYLACALRIIGEAQLAVGAIASATSYFEEAICVQERVDDDYERVLLLRARSRRAYLVGETDQAISLLDAAHELALAQKLPHLLAMVEASRREIVDSTTSERLPQETQLSQLPAAAE